MMIRKQALHGNDLIHAFCRGRRRKDVRRRLGESNICGRRQPEMAIREILQLGDPRLRQPAATHDFASSSIDLPALITDLRETLAHWRKETGYGRGIAAPQLGTPERVIFLQLPGAAPWPLINPQITQRSDERIVVW